MFPAPAAWDVRAPSHAARRRSVPVLASILAAFAVPARVQAQSAPSVGGDWSPLYDWTPQLACPAGCTEKSDLSAAAVLPVGLHRGKIVFWRESCLNCGTNDRTTETYLFDPADPDDLIVIEHEPLATDLFCSGFAWERDGKLLVTGGNPPPVTGQAKWTYHFYPALLEDIRFEPPGSTRIVAGKDAWQRIGDAESSRYYPAVVPLDRRGFGGSPGFAGGGHLVIGGVPNPVAPSGTCEQVHGSGTANWQHIDPEADQWDTRVMYPEGGVGPGTPYVPVAYTRRDLNGTILTAPFDLALNPVPFLETYPRAFQLGDLSSTVQGQVIVANDMGAFANTSAGGNPINPYGASWVVKPTYGSQLNWELQEGRLGHERFYGTAGLWHMLAPFTNRVVVFGGAKNSGTPSAPSWSVVQPVQEFAVTSSAPIAQGQWTNKFNGLNFSRIMANLVILPTGEALLLGGGSGVTPCDAGPSNPVYTPELYAIGNPDGSAATATLMNPPPGVLVPRLYHSMAALLEDGRVLVAAGEYQTGYPHSEKNGQIFSPPYLFQGPRPTIASAPSEASFSTSSAPVTIGVTVNHSAAVDRIVLLRPGSITHAFDIDQRYIEFDFTGPAPVEGMHRFTVTLPREDLGPPGWYMMFAVQVDLQGHRVPSIAWWIRIT